ncbi:MAG: hypothetical protein AAB682_02520 [Patescibacteria group bacterium]
MVTITITKREYENLVEKKLYFDYMQALMKEKIFSPPNIKSSKSVIATLQATKKYNKKFLDDVRDGLSRSKFFTE